MSDFDLALKTDTSPETLARLAKDENSWVRYCVARNHNTPPETLARLANDYDWVVRTGVAVNPSTPQYIRTYLKFMD